ncbi:hypothetical protein, partial [Streptococcus agalactiae]
MKNKKGKVHNYNMNVRRNFEKQQKARRKKVVALVGLVIVLIIGGFGIYSAVSSNGENKEATASQSSSSQ